MPIRSMRSSDADRILEIWQTAVEATHNFITPEEIRFYHGEIRTKYLPALEVYVVEDGATLTGFLGLDDAKVEMLFVDPAQHGRGIGKALLAHARELKGPLSVDVNEENPAAHAFYIRQGFQQTGRSELDASGKPHPILHLAEPQD